MREPYPTYGKVFAILITPWFLLWILLPVIAHADATNWSDDHTDPELSPYIVNWSYDEDGVMTNCPAADGAEINAHDAVNNDFNVIVASDLTPGNHSSTIDLSSFVGNPATDVNGVNIQLWYTTGGSYCWTETGSSVFFVGEPPVPPEPEMGGATSTVAQVQTNLYYGFVIFFVSFFGMVYLLRKRS